MDKQDELAAVIAEALYGGMVAELIVSDGKTPDVFAQEERQTKKVAAAVRSFMGSEEVVERAGNALQQGWSFADDAGLHALPDIEFSPYEREHLARAALSAAIGEDIGGELG